LGHGHALVAARADRQLAKVVETEEQQAAAESAPPEA
jgi:hypothetical protein